MDLILIIVYAVLGAKSIRYCKYHILHVSCEYFTDALQHWLKGIVQGILFGWFTIPVMGIHYLLFGHRE